MKYLGWLITLKYQISENEFVFSGWEKIDRQTDDRRERFKENPDKANSFLLFYLSVVSQLSVFL